MSDLQKISGEDAITMIMEILYDLSDSDLLEILKTAIGHEVELLGDDSFQINWNS